MKKIDKTYEIEAPVEKVWACLTEVEQIEHWSDASASFDAKVGGKFKMWGDDSLSGKVNKLEKNRLLEEDWLVDGMDEPSIALFELSEEDNVTILKLTHSNVPEDLVDELDEGWDLYYLGAIKDYLEN